MNQWGRIKAKNFIIALTLCVTLINENHTYLAKADDETQSSANSYIAVSYTHLTLPTTPYV